MLLKNDLLRYEEDEGRTVRVLASARQRRRRHHRHRSGKTALPTIVRADALIQDVQEKRARLLESDPTSCLPSKLPYRIATRRSGTTP